MYIERHTVSITTDTNGDGTGYTPTVTGEILAIVYTKSNYTDGVDFTITGEGSGIPIWTGSNVNATTTVAPRQATHGTDGVAAVYASGGSAVNDRIPVAKERIKIVVASGGSSHAGTFDVYVGG